VILCEHSPTDFIQVKAIVKRSYQHHAIAILAACCAKFRTSTFSVSSVSGTYFFLFGARAPVGQGLLIHEVSRSHTTTHHRL